MFVAVRIVVALLASPALAGEAHTSMGVGVMDSACRAP